MSDKTLIDSFLGNVAKFGERTFMTQPMGGGDSNVKTFTFNQTLDQAKRMAAYLESLDLPPKSQIAICSKNCAWWVMADLGIWMAGHVSVPVFPTLTKDTTRFILEHSEAKLLFVGKMDVGPWEEMKDGIPMDLPTVTFPLCPATGISPANKTWDDIIKSSEPIAEPVQRTPDEMATIIYTSGSTGKPKGVMTSFKAMMIPTLGVTKILNANENDRCLSYLPIAHGMERWLGECLPLHVGQQIFYAESLKTFVADLNRSKPTLFMSVPRLWTKFQAGVFSKTSESKLNFLLKIPILGWLVKRKVLKALGLDSCRFAGSGSAPLPAELLGWYRKLGLELLEGYGMTEDFNYSHLSMPGKSRLGYVGNAYDDVEQRIAEDGEIQVKSPGMMMGYFKNEEATKETITEDGWLRTGDKGEIDEQGRMKITGRTKEIFKTSKGKYVAPAPIENLYIANHLVELACVGGRAQPQPYAVIQLSEVPKEKAIESEDERKKIGAELEAHLAASNKQIEAHEHLQFLVIVKDDWLPENGFLTPTQKIKRSVIEETYEPNLEKWYGMKQKVIFHGF